MLNAEGSATGRLATTRLKNDQGSAGEHVLSLGARSSEAASETSGFSAEECVKLHNINIFRSRPTQVPHRTTLFFTPTVLTLYNVRQCTEPIR